MVWSFFKDASSLWVAWLRKNVLRDGSYWSTMPTARHSWNIKKLIRMKDLAKRFIRCRIGNGGTALFWHDNWTALGPLLDYIGRDGPRLLRIPINSTVSAATAGGHWSLPGARSSRIQELHVQLLIQDVPEPTRGEDRFEWKIAENVYKDEFSTTSTWRLLRQASPKVE
ncbi:PREDICTED: uncharacterized protein LOC104822537 [Tarenaya hassleriana]|uniref:uncharacterized protein LOC104822537 n=1 Tax=Tarenaya hassleriana TaxID=28532 RepID=UPI00053C6A69|nr:PREDICTED: uncharacterized protein LOC104822537 [Tarenaya hassleriana]